MRWYIIKALLMKEGQRHLANRGGIALALLARRVGRAAVGVRAEGGRGRHRALVGGVHHCFIEYDRETPLIKHLEDERPAGPEGADRVPQSRRRRQDRTA